jgi:hypothetical protein
MTVEINLAGVSCTRCLTRGHRCPAKEFDSQEGPLCVWCLDGERCPKSNYVPEVKVVVKIGAPVAAADAKRMCKCGCGTEVPASNRFSYINGHRPRKATRRAKAAKPANGAANANGHANGNGERAATLHLTEAQLDRFLMRLDFTEKQALARHYLES